MMSNMEEAYEVGEQYTDEHGLWLVVGGGARKLLQPTEAFFKNQNPSETRQEPTLENFLLELDFRQSRIELGL